MRVAVDPLVRVRAELGRRLQVRMGRVGALLTAANRVDVVPSLHGPVLDVVLRKMCLCLDCRKEHCQNLRLYQK